MVKCEVSNKVTWRSWYNPIVESAREVVSNENHVDDVMKTQLAVRDT